MTRARSTSVYRRHTSELAEPVEVTQALLTINVANTDNQIASQRELEEQLPDYVSEAFAVFSLQLKLLLGSQLDMRKHAYAALILWSKSKRAQPYRLEVITADSHTDSNTEHSVHSEQFTDEELAISCLHKHDEHHNYRPMKDENVLDGDDNDNFYGFGSFYNADFTLLLDEPFEQID